MIDLQLLLRLSAGDCVANDVSNCGTCGTACPLVPNGSRTCSSAGQCGKSCSAGFILCGDTCLANDVSNCGTCGTACPQVPNGSPTCSSAGQCGKSCSAGFILCNGECVSTSSTTNCGRCASDGGTCPLDPNSMATCTNGDCGSVCNTGFIFCDGSCVPNSPTNCGSCASATPSGTCPLVLNGSPICSSAGVCGSVCNTGYIPCNGVCVANDVSNCGGCGTSCAEPANGSATCSSAGDCGKACDAGFILCNDQCVSRNTITNCGKCASDGGTCPLDVNRFAICTNGDCGSLCNPGYVLCGNTCVPSGPLNCGSCSNVCDDTDPHASPTCSSSGACGKVCDTGYILCQGVCVSRNSIDSCGKCASEGGVCPRDSSGSATCTNGDCGSSCGVGYVPCGGRCIPNSPTNCGRCAPAGTCPGVANGSATCTGTGVCGLTCNTGYFLCSGQCVADLNSVNCLQYVNSYVVNDGPFWFSNPPPQVVSCVERCAAISGGVPSHYRCSTSRIAVDFQAHVDGWGLGCMVVADDFKRGNAAGEYVLAGIGGPSVSAFVRDHACSASSVNYCFSKPL
jgi:hypothetical protein